MKHRLIAIIENERLTRATHWAVFSLGALSLTFSLAVTAVKVLSS
ncbi:hypothetical protein [Phaeovulum sp.]